MEEEKGGEWGGQCGPPCSPSALTQIVPISASIYTVFHSVIIYSVVRVHVQSVHIIEYTTVLVACCVICKIYSFTI